MTTKKFPLGAVDTIKTVFAYPNIPGSSESLEDTVSHWLNQTLTRDGFDKAKLQVTLDGDNCVVQLDGVSANAAKCYSDRLSQIVKIASDVDANTIQNLIMQRKIWCTDDKDRPMWDPMGTKNWRFFMTLGVGLVNHRSLQFFHYPPSRLLNPLRDSMKDPVTFRCRDLLRANGVTVDETRYYETRINSSPIAAPDDQGTNKTVATNPVTGGYIPIDYFRKFDAQMISALLKPHDMVKGYTIPMTAYGNGPMQQLGGVFLGPDQAVLIEVLPGLKTPVLGSNHPYKFYAQAQMDPNHTPGLVIGSGKMLPGKEVMTMCRQLQQNDLAVVRWQVKMAKDPSRDPWETIRKAQAYWQASKQQKLVDRLVKRHASLIYQDYDPKSTTVSEGYVFGFQFSYEGKPQDPFGPDSN